MVEKMPSPKTKHSQNDLGGQWKMSQKSLYFVNRSQIPTIVFMPWFTVYYFSYLYLELLLRFSSIPFGLYFNKVGLDSL